MTAPTPNVELLRKTLAHIEAHPDEWDQKEWRCGTAGCYAFHAIQLSGEPVEWAFPGNPNSDYLVPTPADGEVEGNVTTINTRARRVLGLTVDQADALFSTYNHLDDLRRLVAAFSEVREPTAQDLQLTANAALTHILQVTGLPLVKWHVEADGVLRGQALRADDGRHEEVVAAYSDLLGAEPHEFGQWVGIDATYMGAPVTVFGRSRRHDAGPDEEVA